jgi:SP family general alpha glucoside:H+ symporter-like MFS transporter
MAPSSVEHVEQRKVFETARLDDEVFAKMAEAVDNFGNLTQDAQQGTQFERKMTLWQAVRMYPKATAFSMIISLSLVMEGE